MLTSLRLRALKDHPNDPDDAWTWDEFVEIATALTVDVNGNHPGESRLRY